jgi:membrane protein
MRIEKDERDVSERADDQRTEQVTTLSLAWWRRVGMMFVQAGRDLVYDNGMSWAAAVAYYALLSVIPLMVAGAILASLFVDPDTAVEGAVDVLEGLLPTGEQDVEEIVRGAIEARGMASFFSIIGLIWTGTRVFGQLIMALNVAFDVDAPWGFLKRFMIEMIMLFSVGLVFLGSILTGPIYSLATDAFGILPGGEGTIYFIITDVLPFLLLIAAFFLLYRFAPRTCVSNRAAIAGTIAGGALFLLSRSIFLYYIQDFADYDIIYGSAAVLVTLILWAWVASLIVIYGGEVASHTQMILVEGMSPREVEMRHRERSQGQSGWSNEKSRVEKWLTPYSLDSDKDGK